MVVGVRCASAGHFHGLGGAGGHLAPLRALRQGAGARAGPIHGVGGGQGRGAGARQAGHAGRSHVAHSLDEVLERLGELRRLSQLGEAAGVGHLQE